MEIVLLILKILGIILLVLLGLILLAVLLVVFYPVSYKLSASYAETLTAKLKVHWLFHLISVTLDYGESGKRCILRILGIPLMDFLNPKPKKEKKKKPQKKKSKKKLKKTPEKENTKSPSLSESEPFYETAADRRTFEPEPEFQEEKTEETAKESLPRKESRLKKLWEKIVQFFTRIKQVVLNIFQKIRDVYDKGVDLKEKAEKWIEILGRERTRLALDKAKYHIISILKHVLPVKWNAYMEIGFDDPATTGKIMGYYWMFIGLWGEHFICVPDFENKVFSGTVDAKGRIQVFKFLYVAYKFMFDKDLVYLRNVYKEVNS